MTVVGAPQDPVPTLGPDPAHLIDAAVRIGANCCRTFNQALADTNTGAKVDNEGNFVNSERQSLVLYCFPLY
jgi:hypothetical protein